MNTQDNSIELGENLSNCLNCPENIDKTDFYLKYDVCPFCNFHYSIDSKKRIQIISDSGTFREFNKNISIKRPENLKIDDTYRKNVKKTRKRTGLEEAAISGTCNIGGIKTVVIISGFWIPWEVNGVKLEGKKNFKKPFIFCL
jgi:Acetyl-CoA carboxylase beta subunit